MTVAPCISPGLNNTEAAKRVSPGDGSPVSPSGSEPFVMEQWLAFLVCCLPLHTAELTENLVPASLTLGFLESS